MGRCKSHRGSTAKSSVVDVLSRSKPAIVKTPESAFIIRFLKK